MLPEREVEAEGRAAVVTRYESVTSSATFVVVSARDTFRTVGMYRTPGGA